MHKEGTIMPKERVTLMLPEGLWDQMKAHAARQRKSASQLAAESMARLVRDEDEAGLAERMAAFQAIINAGLDVPADPEELNRQLAEAYMPPGMEEYQ